MHLEQAKEAAELKSFIRETQGRLEEIRTYDPGVPKSLERYLPSERYERILSIVSADFIPGLTHDGTDIPRYMTEPLLVPGTEVFYIYFELKEGSLFGVWADQARLNGASGFEYSDWTNPEEATSIDSPLFQARFNGLAWTYLWYQKANNDAWPEELADLENWERQTDPLVATIDRVQRIREQQGVFDIEIKKLSELKAEALPVPEEFEGLSLEEQYDKMFDLVNSLRQVFEYHTPLIHTPVVRIPAEYYSSSCADLQLVFEVEKDEVFDEVKARWFTFDRNDPLPPFPEKISRKLAKEASERSGSPLFERVQNEHNSFMWAIKIYLVAAARLTREELVQREFPLSFIDSLTAVH